MAFRSLATTTAILALLGAGAYANPFQGGWKLLEDGSTLNFQSTKNKTIVETSSFAQVSGTINQNGAAEISIELESVDTGIDLRNVRMRFLFFESFQYPTAMVTAQLNPADLEDLNEKRRKIVTLPYVMNLHGVIKTAEAKVAVTLLTDNLVNISTPTPITVATKDYNLDGGVKKLEEAAGVEIVPQAAVTFDFTFERQGVVEGGGAEDAPAEDTAEEALVAELEEAEEAAETATVTAATATSEEVAETEPTSVALEPEGDFTAEACIGRFEILSRTDNITFRTGSALINQDSHFILDQLANIVARCPDMVVEVGGHTDNIGSDRSNQRLSERRAASVVTYLQNKGIEQGVLVAKGYGEAEPAFDNTTADGRSRNRRIGFKVISQ